MTTKVKKSFILIGIGLALLAVAEFLSWAFSLENSSNSFFNFNRSYQEFSMTDADKINLAHIDLATIETIQINVNKSFFRIINGENFALKSKIAANKLKIVQKDGLLSINFRGGFFGNYLSFFGWNRKKALQLEIPQHMNLKKLDVKMGIGEIKLKKLSLKQLNIDVGVAKIKLEDIFISEKFNYDGGIGELNLIDGIVHNANLDLGIGELDFSGDFFGENLIKSGVGEVNLHLARKADFYHISANIGLGETSGKSHNPKAQDKIKIKGGIGEININYAQEPLSSKIRL